MILSGCSIFISALIAIVCNRKHIGMSLCGAQRFIKRIYQTAGFIKRVYMVRLSNLMLGTAYVTLGKSFDRDQSNFLQSLLFYS
jgi:hypothetical protein